MDFIRKFQIEISRIRMLKFLIGILSVETELEISR